MRSRRELLLEKLAALSPAIAATVLKSGKSARRSETLHALRKRYGAAGTSKRKALAAGMHEAVPAQAPATLRDKVVRLARKALGKP